MNNTIRSRYELLGIITAQQRNNKPVNLVLDAYQTFTEGELQFISVDGRHKDNVIALKDNDETFYNSDLHAIRINGMWFNIEDGVL